MLSSTQARRNVRAWTYVAIAIAVVLALGLSAVPALAASVVPVNQGRLELQ